MTLKKISNYKLFPGSNNFLLLPNSYDIKNDHKYWNFLKKIQIDEFLFRIKKFRLRYQSWTWVLVPDTTKKILEGSHGRTVMS